MAMNLTLDLKDVSELRNAARSFEAHASEVKRTTDQMLDLIEQSKGVWRGEAAVKYTTQFAGLQDDMQKIYDMCQEYSTDLIQMADRYENAEETNVGIATRTNADVNLRI